MNDNNKKMNELAKDIFTTLFVKPKEKKLKPLVKQITYKGITKKWTEDGKGNFLEFIGKPKYEYAFIGKGKENESNKDFVKRLIDENYFK